MYWSPSSATALAEAELEYKDDHHTTAAFAAFRVVRLPPSWTAMYPTVDLQKVKAVIWTTTPWTLPANRAIAVHSDIKYAVIDVHELGQLLVAESQIPRIRQITNDAPMATLVDSVDGAELIGQVEYVDAFGASDRRPFIHADFVSADSGTGLVHCAPGHGQEDYLVCLEHGIQAFAPVDDRGCFTAAANPNDPSMLTGLEVLSQGSIAVLDFLRRANLLLHSHDHTHKYPYDWRTKLPVIIRATEQWFADVGSIKTLASKSLDSVHFIPETGRNRLQSFVRGRSEWCISRQRAWGVPIPVLYHEGTGSALLTASSVSHVMDVIEKRGIDAWWEDAEDEPSWTPPALRNPLGGTPYRRGRDTMDVWFDSGTSWTQLTNSSSGDGRALADVYFEGSDQHRGWFQSSLLTYVAAQSGTQGQAQAPFATLVTHGFTLDRYGRKMSKSVGNVISPDQIMDGSLLPPIKRKNGKAVSARKDDEPQFDGLGPDALRLWVASSDYTRDVVISEPTLKVTHASLHKLRMTIKLLLGSLQGFSPKQSIDYQNLNKIDKMALLQLAQVNTAVLAAYQSYEFHKGSYVK